MGKVYLVGAGPGDPDLLTLRAARLLHSADVILHDSLVSQEVLNLAAPTAQMIHIGKPCGRKLLTQQEINSLLIHHASTVPTVVRLKGGDPLIFGRAGEEIQALRNAGIDFEVVPGVTSALAAAAAAGISLTDRRYASHVLFTTAHRRDHEIGFDWDGSPTLDTTIVIYMLGNDYAFISQSLLDTGLSEGTPCVLLSCVSLPDQHARYRTIAQLAHEPPCPAPALLIVGRVAGKEPPAVSSWKKSNTEELGEAQVIPGQKPASGKLHRLIPVGSRATRK